MEKVSSRSNLGFRKHNITINPVLERIPLSKITEFIQIAPFKYLQTILKLHSSLHGLFQSLNSLLPCLIEIFPR